MRRSALEERIAQLEAKTNSQERPPSPELLEAAIARVVAFREWQIVNGAQAEEQAEEIGLPTTHHWRDRRDDPAVRSAYIWHGLRERAAQIMGQQNGE